MQRRIAAGKSRLAELAAEREALGPSAIPTADQLARIESAERLAARQLDRLEGEREGLALEVAIESRRPAGLSAAERSELALIGERLRQLRRREVAAERLQPSKLIEADPGRSAPATPPRRRSGTRASI